MLDSEKYAHTPSATDNVWGVGLKDLRGSSRTTTLRQKPMLA